MLARHFVIGLAAGIAALAVGVPLAGAGDRVVDDYWRDPTLIAAPSSNTIVDDYWRDQTLIAAPSSNTMVDDYWRDGLRGAKATPAVTDRIVDDYFRDAQPSVEARPGVSNRIVDDYFRDAPPVVATSDGFDWGDFGIGVAVAIGSMLMLAGFGAAALAVRLSRGGKTGPAKTA